MKKRFISLWAVILMALSLLAFLYPAVSSQINALVCKGEIESCKKVINSSTDEELEKMLADAEKYNEKLLSRVKSSYGISALEDIKDPSYDEIMNITKEGQMGAVIIPKINVDLPIYHGTDDSFLDTGAAHMCGTSFPVGGESTHSCISAHTAYPGKIFFDDIIKLEKGDEFFISSLRGKMRYVVTDIYVVKPDDTSHLNIEKGKDLVTLITCTPYAVNTHRLLVTGERDESYDENKENIQDTSYIERSVSFKDYWAIVLYLIDILFIIIYTVIFFIGRKRNEK